MALRDFGLCKARLLSNFGIWRIHRLSCKSHSTEVFPQSSVNKKHQTVDHPDKKWSSSPLQVPSTHDLTMTCHVNSLGFALAGLSVDTYKLNTTESAYAAKYLTGRQYEYLESSVPYLEGVDSDRAFWYLCWTNNLSAFMEPMRNDSAMSALSQLIEEKTPLYTPLESAEVLRSLVYIGYDTTSPVFHKLYFHAKARIHCMDINALVLLGSISHDIVDYDMIRSVISRCHELFENGLIPQNSTTLKAFCALVKILRFHLSHSAQEKMNKYLLDFVHNVPYNSMNLDTIVSVIGTACVLTKYGQNVTQKQIIEAVKKDLINQIHDCQPIHLDKISSNLRLINQYDHSIQRAVDARVQHLVERGDVGFSEVFLLFSCLTQRSEGSLIKSLERLVEDTIARHPADIDNVLVWTLAKALHDVNSTNVKLVTFVQSKVAGCFIGEPWLPFLTQKEFARNNHKNEVVEALLTNVKHGIHNNKLTCIYILGFMSPMRSEAHKKLIDLIGTWNAEELTRFLQGLMEWQRQVRRNQLQKPVSVNSWQYRTALAAVCENIVEKFDGTNPWALCTTINCLNPVSFKYHTQNDYLHTILDQYYNYVKGTISSMTSFSLYRLLCFCNMSSYFDPDLIELVSDAVQQADELHDSLYTRLFHYLGCCGYVPQNMDELIPKSEWLLEELDKSNSLFLYLQTMVNLVVMNRVSDDLLCSVFTKEFLHRLHVSLLDHPEQRLLTYQYLVFLNQCAVIDYPHLQVPWFLDEVAMKCRRKDESIGYHKSVLEDVVGGPEFFKTYSLTPFTHQMTFELVADRNNTILSWQTADGRKDVNRVAIILENTRNYCLVPKGVQPRMKGKSKREIEQFEKLGYEVVAVPFYEWRGRTRSQYTEYLQQQLANVHHR